MSLSQIESLTPAMERLLEKDDWTVIKVATTNTLILSQYRGISRSKALVLIADARAIVNTIQEELAGVVAPAPPVEMGMSPRVRRAVMSSDQEWNK